MVIRLFLPAFFCLAISASALAAETRSDFAIFRNGEKVGRYSFVITEEGRTRRVHATMHVAVKLVGVTVYQASHERWETWAGNRLQSMKGRSLYNGKPYDLELRRSGDSASLTVNGVTQPLGSNVFTFVPWFIEGETSVCLITEKGRLIEMSAVDSGLDSLPGEGGGARLRHCVYRSRQPRDAWYDREGTLVRMTYTHNNAAILLRRETLAK